MPTRSASDYLSFVKAQVQSYVPPNATPQSGGIGPRLSRTTPYNQGGVSVLNAITQASAMTYVTTGQVAPARVIGGAGRNLPPREPRKALSRVAFLSGGGVLGPVVSQPATRFSGTQSLIVLQTNLIQNANQNAGKSGSFNANNQSVSGGAF